MHIDQIVEWSRTAHGGKQTVIFPEPPNGGGMRYGMCEPPTTEAAPDRWDAADAESEGR